MRRAVVRTPLSDAARVAAAVRPDNTPELSTEVVDGAVVTTISRETTGGLRATVDDYLVNLAVAHETGRTADETTSNDSRHLDANDETPTYTP